MVAHSTQADYIANYNRLAELENIISFLQVNIYITKLKLGAIRAKASILCQLSQNDREQFQRWKNNLDTLDELKERVENEYVFLLSVQSKYAVVLGHYDECEYYEELKAKQTERRSRR